MAGLSNIYLLNLAKKLNLKKFKGIFSCDTLPKPEKHWEEFSLISNLSKYDEKGSHFIAIYVLPDKIIYFDSYGIKCTNEFINEYLQTIGKNLFYNTRRIQDVDSIFCGYFCLAFILVTESSEYSFDNFMNNFDKKNLLNNENIVTRIIRYFIQS